MKQKNITRYKENPFLKNMEIKRKDKAVILGKDSNIAILDKETGEVTTTHIATYRKVDNTEFVKIFTQNIAAIFDLTSAGTKAFGVLMWAVQNQGKNTDRISITAFELNEFNENYQKDVSMRTLYRGLKELEKAQIIAKTILNAFYYINPNFIFNGDRIVFSSVIERKKIISSSNKETSEHSTEHPNQAKLPL